MPSIINKNNLIINFQIYNINIILILFILISFK